MNILIRIADAAGGHSDSEHSLNRLMLGSANDAHLQLPLLELRHATIEKGRDGLMLRSIARGGVKVNGNVVKRCVLRPGDLIELPGAGVQVEDAADGFDAILSVHREAGHTSVLSSQRMSLADTFLAKRTFAWIGALVILAGMFVLPLLFSGERAADSPVAALMSDHVWTSGELHTAHELVTGDNCAGCHEKPFERVQNETCATCHGAIQDHVGAGFLAATSASAESGGMDFSVNANERCGVCHREHNEPSTLVSDADSDCVQCHATDNGIHRAVDPLAAVAGFTPETHPVYEFSLPRFKLEDFAGSQDDGWQIEAVSETEIANSPETSELIFPHDIHLDAGEVTDLVSGDALTCGSCHSLSVDGEHFLPVDMETHCEDCHQLDFDESDPERSLPHARLKEAVLALEGMLLKKYFDPDDTGELFAYRRLPDREARAVGCTDAPDVCVERELKEIVEAQFTGDIGCAACHKFARQDSKDIEDQFWVHPVKLPQDFVPDARFDHVAHQVLRDNDTNELLIGDQACDTCHAAESSDSATDLLMPVMTTCYECHGDRHSAAQVALTCIDCHEYHPRGLGGATPLQSALLDGGASQPVTAAAALEHFASRSTQQTTVKQAAQLWKTPVTGDTGGGNE